MLARNAARTEDDRRVVEENIALIDEAGLFSIMRPTRLGGLETDIRTKLEVSRELARGCGSTAWATTLMNVCAFFAGLFPDQAQRDVLARTRRATASPACSPRRRRRPGSTAATG